MSVKSELMAQGKFIQKNSQFIFYEMPMLCIYNEKTSICPTLFTAWKKLGIFSR